jgi:arsenate reductase
MAEGFLKHYAKIEKLLIEVQSGGTRPAGYVHPLATQVMAEQGVDISGHESKGIQPAELSKFDYVISMGCSDEDICPVNFSGVSRDWSIVDPFGHSIEFYRQVRDEIQKKVQLLAQELTKL